MTRVFVRYRPRNPVVRQKIRLYISGVLQKNNKEQFHYSPCLWSLFKFDRILLKYKYIFAKLSTVCHTSTGVEEPKLYFALNIPDTSYFYSRYKISIYIKKTSPNLVLKTCHLNKREQIPLLKKIPRRNINKSPSSHKYARSIESYIMNIHNTYM